MMIAVAVVAVLLVSLPAIIEFLQIGIARIILGDDYLYGPVEFRQ